MRAARKMKLLDKEVQVAKLPYKNRSSFGKALKRVKNMLPSSPSKKFAIISHLAKDSGCNIINSCSRTNT